MSDAIPHVNYELTFPGTAEAEAEWTPYALQIEEALDHPYRAVLDVLAPSDANTHALLGADATLTITRDGGEAQHVHAVVVQLDELEPLRQGPRVRVHLAPAFEEVSGVDVVHICRGHGGPAEAPKVGQHLASLDAVENRPVRPAAHEGQRIESHAPCSNWFA